MWMRALAAAALLAGCAAPPQGTERLDALLLGEQHDAEAHPQAQRDWVERLARGGRLAALVLEMAERGHDTRRLPATASEADVQRALQWNDEAWPWARYAPVVMAAVRAGVPVLGANVPRDELRLQMNNTAIDRVLPPQALQKQQEAIRKGHCDLLPQRQVPSLARVQIARDLAMAEVVAAAAAPGKTVVLVAGSGHVHATLGVPQHLPRQMAVRVVTLPAQETGKDYCAELRRQMVRPVS